MVEIIGQTAWPELGGGGAAIAVVGYLILRLIRQESRQSRHFWVMAQYELAQAKRENRVCQRRLAMVIDECRAEGLSISDRVWSVPETEEPPILLPEELKQ